MSPQGDDRPPRRSGGSEGGGKPKKPQNPGGSGDSGKGESGKKPEYTVYGRGGKSGQKRSGHQARKPGERREKPPYRVYRSRPSLRDRLRKPSLASLQTDTAEGGWRGRLKRLVGGRRPWLRWVLIVAFGWLLLSVISFGISAQIQKGKLRQSAKEALKGGPDVLLGQNILIIGGDRRGKTQRNATGSEGQGPPRADTIMVLHASLTSFHKLSIPRDSFASIPDCGEQKINASLACNTNSPNGNPASTIKTVENFLGIDINHIVIVNFDGFAEFINTIGGVKIDVPGNPDKKGAAVCGDVDGGKKQGGVSLKLPPGEVTLQGDKALAYSRLRHNNCDPSEDDRDRAARQQAVLDAIKGRLTSITRFPYNFIKGPFIGWDAPKAFISDMGGFTLPQVAIAAIIGGNGATNVLGGSGAKSEAQTGPGGSLAYPDSVCLDAVKQLIGGDPPHHPACTPSF